MKELNQFNHSEALINNKFIILDFWAEWCGPCKRFSPIFEEVSKKYPQVFFAKVNSDLEMELSIQYGIRSIPTLIFIKNGQIVDRVSGAMSEVSFSNLVDEFLK